MRASSTSPATHLIPTSRSRTLPSSYLISQYFSRGAEGIDFAANLAISTLDFGTFHLYPVPWGATADPTAWGTQWIADHAALQKSVGKPVIIEEFGLDADDQVTPYKAWLGQVISSGLAGDLIW